MALFNEAQTYDWFQSRYEKMGLSQADLAKQCGISSADLSRYANRKQYPRLDVINKLATALDVTPIELMVGLGVIDGEKPPTIRKSRFGGSITF